MWLGAPAITHSLRLPPEVAQRYELKLRVIEGGAMEFHAERRVLVVANRTSATPDLLDAVKRYAA